MCPVLWLPVFVCLADVDVYYRIGCIWYLDRRSHVMKTNHIYVCTCSYMSTYSYIRVYISIPFHLYPVPSLSPVSFNPLHFIHSIHYIPHHCIIFYLFYSRFSQVNPCHLSRSIQTNPWQPMPNHSIHPNPCQSNPT